MLRECGPCNGYIKHETFSFCFGTMHTQNDRHFKIDGAEIQKLANKQWRSISPNVVDAKINHFIAE